MPGRPGRYDLAKVAQWREDKRAAKEREKAADPAAENLDRYRLAKAELAVLELEERRGILLPVARVKEGLLRVATMIRRLGERLGQQYGDEATYAVNETVQEFERVITSELNGTHVDTTAN